MFVISKIDELEAPVGPQIDASLKRLTLTHDPDVALLGLSFPNGQDAAFAAFQTLVSNHASLPIRQPMIM